MIEAQSILREKVPNRIRPAGSPYLYVISTDITRSRPQYPCLMEPLALALAYFLETLIDD